MHNMVEHIRERAYHLWLADGCQHGRADRYWLAAEREVLAARVTPIATPGEAAGKAKPARKPRATANDQGEAAIARPRKRSALRS